MKAGRFLFSAWFINITGEIEMWRGPIGTYYFLTILRTCGITACTAVYASFLLSKGLNLFEINLINVAFFVTLFLCEVPTGAFADVFGRKTSVVLSCGVFTLGMLIYAASDGFWGFIVAEILAAIAATLVSGAFDAWLVDSLKHQGSDRPLRPIFARATQIRHGSGLLAALLGAIIADYSIELPWILGACFFALAGIAAALLMKEEYFERRAFSIPSGIEALKDTLSASVEFGIRNSSVRFVMLTTLGLFFATMAPNMQWQPYFKQWLPTQSSLGVLYVAMALCLMFGAALASRLVRMMRGERNALLVCQAGVALAIIGTVATGLLPAAVAVFLLHEIPRGAFEPIKTAYLHDNIPSKERATIVSFESISHHFGGALGLLASGLLAHYVSIPAAWIGTSLVLLLLAVLLWRNGR